MNFNSKILKISIIVALIFMLIPIVAAEDVDDTSYAAEEADAIAIQEDADDAVLEQNQIDDDLLGEEETTDGDDDYSSEFEPFVSVPLEDDELSADLEITSHVTPKNLKVGNYAVFTFIVTNYGPDTATNVVAYANIFQGDVYYISSTCDQGDYNSYTGIWTIGDLEAGESVVLTVLGKVASDVPIITMAYVSSDTPDPDTSNNFYMETIQVESENTVAAETEKMPATGNPIVMVLLAVLAMVGVTVRKRF